MLKAIRFITSLDDMAMMRESIQQGCRHLGIHKYAGPFGETQVGRDDDAGVLVQFR